MVRMALHWPQRHVYHQLADISHGGCLQVEKKKRISQHKRKGLKKGFDLFCGTFRLKTHFHDKGVRLNEQGPVNKGGMTKLGAILPILFGPK